MTRGLLGVLLLSLIAHYPLDHDLDDATGHLPPLDVKNAPLQPGKGLFCNGRYAIDHPDGCDVRTPRLPDKRRAFTTTGNFKSGTSFRGSSPVGR